MTAIHSGGAATPAPKAGATVPEDPSPWRRHAWAGRLFVAPNLVAVALFMLFPLGFSLYMSFRRGDVFTPPKVVGLKNFGELFTADPLFLIAIRNTV
ncbi:sugar ABC transporter permease, partial [Mycobacterium tuberculosis]|nr:sugar ABC transporter permease [Mycobacterium tuberculosis]